MFVALLSPEAEKRRVHALGMDPAVKQFRPSEAETAVRIENHLGVRLRRAPSWSRADWVDQDGRTYDAVGNFASCYFDRQWPQLRYQIERHLTKADLVPVDVSGFTPGQVRLVAQFIARFGQVFLVGH